MQIRSTAMALVLLAVLSGATPAPASAQGSSGVLLGFNSAEMDFDVPELGTLTFDRRNGFVGGIFIERTLQGPFGVEIDALFAQKGTTIDFDFAGEEPFVIKVDYLDIPVWTEQRLQRRRARGRGHRQEPGRERSVRRLADGLGRSGALVVRFCGPPISLIALEF